MAGLDARIGGPPVSARNSAIAAARAGIPTTVVFPQGDGAAPGVAETVAALRAEGIAVESFATTRSIGRFGPRWGLSFGLARWLVRHARSFDVIHAHGTWVLGAPLAVAIARLTGRRAALTPHEGMTRFDVDQTPRPLTKLGKRGLKPLLAAGFDLFVMSSELEARESVGGRARERCRIAFHPIYDDRAETVASRAGPIEAGGLRLGFLARLHPKKNLDLLIRALARLPAGITLTVAGDGPAEIAASYRDLARALGVEDRIRWLGFVDGAAKEAFFRSIDLLALPSAFECFGMAAAEALVRGIPVMVSPDTGIAEVLQRHGGGVVCRAEAEAVAREIGRLAEHPEALTKLSHEAATAAREALSFSAHGAALAEAYAILVKRSA